MSWFFQCLSNRFLKQLIDGAATIVDGELFQMFVILHVIKSTFPEIISTSMICFFKLYYRYNGPNLKFRDLKILIQKQQ